MERDRLFEFLDLGVSGYCRRYGFQCCSFCEREGCGDNTNPLVIKIRKLESASKPMDDSTAHNTASQKLLSENEAVQRCLSGVSGLMCEREYIEGAKHMYACMLNNILA